MIITVSFLPVFALEAQEGRLFKPLAFTKTFAMAGGALLSVTLVPVLMLLFVRGKIMPEQKNPVNRFLVAAYRPVIDVVLRHRMATIAIALVALFASLRSEEHTSELQSIMRISYAVFCLKKKKEKDQNRLSKWTDT